MKLLDFLFKNKISLMLFGVLVVAFILRFWGLGYSHFYADETKVFYLDKTVPAFDFFMDQRKGPVQFLISWITEKFVGGFDEFYSRIPFVIAGWLSIPVFFLVVQKLFNDKVAVISSFLYTFNGFYIAFSRTIQYQSFLLLFGFLAILFALYYLDEKSTKAMAISSSLMLAIAHLCHYDAVFFDVAIVFILIKKISTNKSYLKEIAFCYLLPFVAITGIFYIPYIIRGYYYSNTFNYVAKRLTGNQYSQNASWYTFWAYNPSLVWAFLIIFVMPFFFKTINWSRRLVLIWFLIPFLVFDYIILNPGTHIHNYIIPLIIIISLGIYDTYVFIGRRLYKIFFVEFMSLLFFFIVVINFYVFIPAVNTGYPWKNSKILSFDVVQVNKRYNLYLYGFPYYRGWDEIKEYVNDRGGFRYIFTNDDDDLARYYLRGISYSPPGPNYLPQYYIHIEDSQEFYPKNEEFIKNLDINYSVEKEFLVNGEKTASIYKLNEKKFPE